MHATPYGCVVQYSAGQAGIAEQAAVLLAALGELEVRLQLSGDEDSACDLYIPVTAAPDCASVAARLGLLRRDHPTACALPLVLGLDEPALAVLFAAGACDFLSVPLEAGAIGARVRRALGTQTARPTGTLRTMMSPRLKDLVGSSPAFARSLDMLPTLAGYDAGVLILGETGTGKEVYARAIHYSSSRAAGPWVAINCGAVPVDLLESELFGHVRGAFTHAQSARPGLVREAEGGTLFLDEIDSMPLAAQSKLLRFVQEMEYRPVGGDKLVRANVRILSASNQNLRAMAEHGSFRRDLYFRLSVLTVCLPPLRERREDILELAQHFIDHFCSRMGKAPLSLGAASIRCMLEYGWPGNVRELRHSIERAVLMGRQSMLRAEDLQIPMIDPGSGECAAEPLASAKARMVAQFEMDYIRRQLVSCKGNITHAAQAAGKNRRAFFELMRKYDISPDKGSLAPAAPQEHLPH